MMLEKVVHARRRRRVLHGCGSVADDPRHPAIDVARRIGRRDVQQKMSAADRPQRRLPGRGEAVEHARLAGQPVGRRIKVVGVGDLAGKSAAAMLLLVDVAQQRAGMRRAGDDPDLREAAEVFVLVHDPPPFWWGYWTPARNGDLRNGFPQTCVMIMTAWARSFPSRDVPPMAATAPRSWRSTAAIRARRSS